MNDATDRQWLYFDVQGVGVHLDVATPAARQVATLLGGFGSDTMVPADLVLTGEVETMVEASILDDRTAFTEAAVHFGQHDIQVVGSGSGYRIHGAGHLVTAVLPVLDLLTVRRDLAMIHAATVADYGRAVVLGLPGEQLRTNLIGRFMRRPGTTVVASTWSLVTTQGHSLGFPIRMPTATPRRPAYRRLLLPVGDVLDATRRHRSLGAPLARLSTATRPRARSIERRPAVARYALRRPAGTEAPLDAAVIVERYDGARTRTVARSTDWMVQRLVGSSHLALPGPSRHLLAGMAATSQLSLPSFLEDKSRICYEALASVPGFVVRIPSVYSPEIASDEIVRVVAELLAPHANGLPRHPIAPQRGPAS